MRSPNRPLDGSCSKLTAVALFAALVATSCGGSGATTALPTTSIRSGLSTSTELELTLTPLSDGSTIATWCETLAGSTYRDGLMASTREAGSTTWSAPVLVSSDGSAGWHRVASLGGHTSLVVWAEFTNFSGTSANRQQLWARTVTSDLAMSEPVLLDQASDGALVGFVTASDRRAQAIVAWSSSDQPTGHTDYRARRYSTRDGWSALEEMLPTTTDEPNAGPPQLGGVVIGSDGAALVVGQAADASIWARHSSARGAWSDAGVPAVSGYPSVCGTSPDSALVSWYPPGSPSETTRLSTVHASPGGGWSAIETLDDGPPMRAPLCDRTGHAWQALWSESYEAAVLRRHDLASGWGPAISSELAGETFGVELSASDGTSAALAWVANDPTHANRRRIVAQRFDPSGGALPTTTVITGSPGIGFTELTVAIDTNDKATIGWFEITGGGEFVLAGNLATAELP